VRGSLQAPALSPHATVFTCYCQHSANPARKRSRTSPQDQSREARRFCISANGVMRTRLRRLARAKPFQKPPPRQASGQIDSQPPRFYAGKTALSGFLCGSAYSVLCVGSKSG
jgi:hypothetical protein